MDHHVQRRNHDPKRHRVPAQRPVRPMSALLALGGALLAIAVVVGYTLRSGAPPTPTVARARRTMLDLAFADRPDHAPLPGSVYDLGAGWGGLASAAARRAPDRPVIGWEISPLPWLVARTRQRALGPGNLTLRRGNFMAADLSDAAVVMCYLHRPLMERLAVKLADELRPGTIVVSNFFQMPGWRPERTVQLDDLYSSVIYLYRVPPHPDGAGGPQ